MAFTKLIVIAAFIGIVASLGSAMLHMVRDKGDSARMLRALTWRIGLSVALFAALFLAYGLGWIQPHGVMPGG